MDLKKLSRILALGGSICHVLRGSEALGGSICRVLQGSEALGGRMSNQLVAPSGSAKERPSRAWGEGGGGGGRLDFVVFYEGLRLWEADLYVFYESLRLWEARYVMFY